MQGIDFEVIPSQFEENLDKSHFKHPSDYVKENSKRKALDVFISNNSKVSYFPLNKNLLLLFVDSSKHFKITMVFFIAIFQEIFTLSSDLFVMSLRN